MKEKFWKFLDSMGFSIFGLVLSFFTLFLGAIAIVSIGALVDWFTFGIGVLGFIFYINSIVKIAKRNAKAKYGNMPKKR